MNEQWLHQIWGNRLYESLHFEPHPCIPLGVEPKILDPGRYNSHGGPDFFNVKLRIGQIVWAGNGELHDTASTWFSHRHHLDEAYNNVVLHIVLQDDAPITLQSGTPPITCIMRVNPSLMAIAQRLTETPQIPRCKEFADSISSPQWKEWQERLFAERLAKKSAHIQTLLDGMRGDVAGVTHLLLMRYLGGKVNNEPFELLARQLPHTILQKRANAPLDLEALLLGTANLLNADRSEKSDPSTEDEYLQKLRRQYTLLQAKYQLSPIARGTIKMLRMRPASFPHRRLAVVAALYHHRVNLSAQLLGCRSLDVLKNLLDVPLSDYWQHHYHFGVSTPKALPHLSDDTIRSIAINVVIPMQHYLSTMGYAGIVPDVVMRGESLPAERNSVINRFRPLKAPLSSAKDSQALLQLYESYCIPHRCWACAIGRTIMQHYAPDTLPPSVSESGNH